MWIWGSSFAPLGCKAELFERLGRQSRGGWPETVVVRSLKELDAVMIAPPVYVKHPRRGGGSGTRRATTSEDLRQFATQVLAITDAVVLQQAITPARLPKGPSIFELRVWSLFCNKGAYTFSECRGKTANVNATLMNRRVQEQEPDFGKFYDHNIASEADLRRAVPGFDDVTKPTILQTIDAVYAAVRDDLPLSTFFFIGFDFILTNDGSPFLIEANIKPSTRYADPDVQFPSPIVRRLAKAALADLSRLLDTDFSCDDPGDDHPRWQRHNSL